MSEQVRVDIFRAKGGFALLAVHLYDLVVKNIFAGMIVDTHA